MCIKLIGLFTETLVCVIVNDPLVLTCYTKTQSSRLHNLPRYMYIYIWANRWSHMAPKPMSTVGSAGNSIYYLQYMQM
jgi:hypothetical protein